VDTAGPAVAISGDRPTGSFEGRAEVVSQSMSVRGADATVTSDEGALVTFALNDDPSLHVEVDGRSVQPVSVDGALVGVFVDAGEHRVTVRYHNATFRKGALLTGLTVIACAGWLVWDRRRAQLAARQPSNTLAPGPELIA
jgi:uncharacterized membrane protein YfhO